MSLAVMGLVARRWSRAGLATLVVAVGLVGTAQPALGLPQISVKPVSGPVGTTIEVTGSGFSPGFPPCEITFDGVVVTSCTVDGSGNVAESFAAPSRSAGVA